MARKVAFVVLSIAIVAAAMFLPVCYLFERNSMVEVLSGPERAYAVVGLKTEGNWMSLGGVRWSSAAFSGIFRLRLAGARRCRDDLLVFEITPEEITSHRLENFGSTGGVYIFEGVLHYGRGGSGDDWPAVWRWHDDHFERLEREVALAMRETYRYESDLLQHEGWEKRDSWYSDSVEHGGNLAELSVGKVKISFIVKGFLNQGATPTPSPLRVILTKHPSGDRTLVDSEPSVRYFRWREYSAVESLGPAESARKSAYN